jgi:mRNA interferase RelE/StbE
MNRYTVRWSPKALKELADLENRLSQRIQNAVATLAENPRPIKCIKLSGCENEWRIRIGDYRVVYEIHDDQIIVLVVGVGHRREIYR